MGIESPAKSSEKSALSSEGSAKSGALATQSGPIDLDLASLIHAWPALPEPIRAGILAMIRATGG
jgi:hypothetical protein